MNAPKYCTDPDYCTYSDCPAAFCDRERGIHSLRLLCSASPRCVKWGCNQVKLEWLEKGRSLQTRNGFFTSFFDQWICPICGGGYGRSPAPNNNNTNMKYRKKPIVIEATQWFKNGDHPQDDVMRPFEDTGRIPSEPREGLIVRYYRHPGIVGSCLCAQCEHKMEQHGWIDTFEGGHVVCPGDWIITGIKGERYPCKPYIFAETYEPYEPSL